MLRLSISLTRTRAGEAADMADLQTNVAVRDSVVVASALTRKFGDLIAVDRVSFAIIRARFSA
jgi:hypothetical protein